MLGIFPNRPLSAHKDVNGLQANSQLRRPRLRPSSSTITASRRCTLSLSRDEARPIALDIAPLPDLLDGRSSLSVSAFFLCRNNGPLAVVVPARCSVASIVLSL
jgi:hypothetical protein